MKKIIIATGAALFSLSYLPASLAAGSTFDGGTIKFHGVIIDHGCTIDGMTDPSSYVKDVAMGSYTPSDFSGVGALAGSGAVDASLELTDCPAGVTAASVTLTSTENEDADLPTNFAIKTGGDAAKGVALQMQYGAGAPSPAGTQIDYNVESVQFPIVSGAGTIALQAQYIATQDPTDSSVFVPGTAENNVQVALNYY